MSDHITITLDRTNEVIDLEDFAALFSGLGSQFDDFLKQSHPEVHGHAQMGIRELRQGSLIMELAAVIMPNVINLMDNTVILQQFLKLVRERYDILSEGRFLSGARKKDLQSVTQSVQAIANDSNAKATYQHEKFDSGGKLREKTSFTIDTEKANKITETAARQKNKLETSKNLLSLLRKVVWDEIRKPRNRGLFKS
jgi:hypothetical protein